MKRTRTGCYWAREEDSKKTRAGCQWRGDKGNQSTEWIFILQYFEVILIFSWQMICRWFLQSREKRGKKRKDYMFDSVTLIAVKKQKRHYRDIRLSKPFGYKNLIIYDITAHFLLLEVKMSTDWHYSNSCSTYICRDTASYIAVIPALCDFNHNNYALTDKKSTEWLVLLSMLISLRSPGKAWNTDLSVDLAINTALAV